MAAVPISLFADYVDIRYRLWTQLFRNLFSQNVRLRGTDPLLQCKNVCFCSRSPL